MNQKHSKEYKSIGQTNKKYRKLRGLTQEQLAEDVYKRQIVWEYSLIGLVAYLHKK